MSNTATISVYDDTRDRSEAAARDSAALNAALDSAVGLAATAVTGAATLAAAAVVAGASGAVTAAGWLCHEDVRGRRERSVLRDRLRAERVAGARAPRLETIALRLADPAALVQAAERLGYTRVQGATGAGRAPVLLHAPTGERVAIQQRASGRVVLRTAAPRRAVEAIVRQHVVVQAERHLAARGYAVRAETLANGETQLVAREVGVAGASGADGRAVVTASVGADGLTAVDVDCVRGARCERIVDDLARAVGGEATVVRKKPAYFQLPGESAHVRRRV